MPKNSKYSFTKKEISRDICSKIGFSNSYANIITNDFIEILKILLKNNEINIKNFGSFKIIAKKERLGRNPKDKKTYIIKARKSVSFKISNNLKKKVLHI